MPRNLDPAIVAFPQRLARGALAVLPGRQETSGQVKLLRFQYNPETVTRTRQGQWEERRNQQGGASPAPQERALQDAHRGGGLFAKSETISFKLVFDATELILKGEDGRQGVLPELGVLENVALAKPNREDGEARRDNDLVSLNPSELLLLLGGRRYPVVITNLTITEQRFDPNLVPIRAEVDVRLRVLEASEVAGNAVVSRAFTQLVAARAAAAQAGTYATAASEDEAIGRALEGLAGGRNL